MVDFLISYLISQDWAMNLSYTVTARVWHALTTNAHTNVQYTRTGNTLFFNLYVRIFTVIT